MANELSVTIQSNVAKGNWKESFAPGNKRIDVDVFGSQAGTVTVGNAAEEDMPIGDVSTVGWLFLENIDDTNFVTYGPNVGGLMQDFGRLEAGEAVAFRLEPGITLRWQANTADVQVKMLLLED